MTRSDTNVKRVMEYAPDIKVCVGWDGNKEDPMSIVDRAIALNAYKVQLFKQYFNKDLHYAVTAVNRFGIEGKPSVAPADIISEQRIKPALFIRLPQLPNNLDAQFFVIETAEGTIIDTQPYNSVINIKSLPTGMYIIRTLGKKAVMHRIGWLKVSQDKNKQKSAELKMIWRK
jgi:hypothetical protein